MKKLDFKTSFKKTKFKPLFLALLMMGRDMSSDGVLKL